LQGGKGKGGGEGEEKRRGEGSSLFPLEKGGKGRRVITISVIFRGREKKKEGAIRGPFFSALLFGGKKKKKKEREREKSDLADGYFYNSK